MRRIGIGGRGLAFALLALFAGLGPSAQAASPGKNGELVFVRRDSGGVEQLFTILPDGTGLTQLTFGTTCSSGPEGNPDWSPDGNRIADQHFHFAANGNCGVWDIDLRAADGTSVQQITNLGDAANPKWSLDGSKILFQSSPSITGAGFVVMNADGTGQVSLGQFAGYSPAWGPNNKIVYVGASDTCLYTMNADGTGSAKLAGAPCSGANYPDWSPDGSKIVYSLNGGPCNGYTTAATSTWSTPTAAAALRSSPIPPPRAPARRPTGTSRPGPRTASRSPSPATTTLGSTSGS